MGPIWAIVSEKQVITISHLLDRIGRDEGQDVAEYAIMLAVVLVIIIGVVRMVGANAGTVFSEVASTIQ